MLAFPGARNVGKDCIIPSSLALYNTVFHGLIKIVLEMTKSGCERKSTHTVEKITVHNVPLF